MARDRWVILEEIKELQEKINMLEVELSYLDFPRDTWPPSDNVEEAPDAQ